MMMTPRVFKNIRKQQEGLAIEKFLGCELKPGSPGRRGYVCTNFVAPGCSSNTNTKIHRYDCSMRSSVKKTKTVTGNWEEKLEFFLGSFNLHAWSFNFLFGVYLANLLRRENSSFRMVR